MKNNILSFLLGIFITLTLAFTVKPGTFMTVKPAKPVSTVVFTSRSENDVAQKIREYASQGYIVKEIAVITSDSSIWYKFVVVMEKY